MLCAISHFLTADLKEQYICIKFNFKLHGKHMKCSNTLQWEYYGDNTDFSVVFSIQMCRQVHKWMWTFISSLQRQHIQKHRESVLGPLQRPSKCHFRICWQVCPLIWNTSLHSKGELEHVVDLCDIVHQLQTNEQKHRQFWALKPQMQSPTLFTCLIWPLVICPCIREGNQTKRVSFPARPKIQVKM
jgi:hypothetical protein